MDKKLSIFLVFFLITGYIFSQGGIKGKIIDKNGNGVPLADVYIKSLSKGMSTSNDGAFEIIDIENGTYNLTISSLGYSTIQQKVSINNDLVDLGSIIMNTSSLIMDEVVVSGSRKVEKITESPATINVVSARQLDKFVGNPGELFAQQKGVDFARTGAFLSGFNVRGFNSAFNAKMLQLDDNRFSTLIATGLPFGPMGVIIKEDIERVETVLGPSSALYGPNALNGLINTITKSPYKYEGTDIVLGAGSNKLLSARIRHAKRIGEKWAYKVTGEYSRGEEINWTDSIYIAKAKLGIPVNPGDDPFVGKAEVDLDRDVSFIKGQASVFYQPTETSEIGLTYGAANSNYISVTNAGRNQIKDWKISFLQATYKSKHWFGQLYKTWSKSDKTFNIASRTQNYWVLTAAGQTHEEALKNSLDGPTPNNFKDDSERLNAEIQYNNSWGNFDLVVGGQYQRDEAYSHQTYLLDENGPIEVDQKGVYGQLKYTLGDSGFNIIVSGRGDDHDTFGFNFIPKAGITYVRPSGTWRITYGKGFATPSILATDMSLLGIAFGNGEGFTMSDGKKIDPLVPETVKTWEVGYKGSFAEDKLYLDVNAYYSLSDNFQSALNWLAPNVDGTVVDLRGNTPIEDLTPGLAPGYLDPGAYILTYKNFGHVDSYGFDIGINYYFSNHYNLSFNYSFFDYNLDEDDLKNDGNGDGVVDYTDIPINAPNNKFSSALNITYDKFYGSVLARWIQSYNFISGKNVSSETNEDWVVGGSPVVEGERVGVRYNWGPLGGFYLSLNGGYRISETFSIGGYINNIIGEGNYEFVASPPSEIMYGVELKISL